MKRENGAQELLDGALQPRTLRANLRDLSRVNRWLDGRGLSWRALRPFMSEGRVVSLLDVGTGAADIPRALLARAKRSALGLEVVATDVREEIIAAATDVGNRTGSLIIRRAERGRIDEADASFDVVHASLVLHHLEPADATALLRQMRRVARHAVVINDLDRRRLWWAGAWLMAHLFTRNRYTRHDAPLSVQRAYRPDEVAAMAARVGLREVARHWSRPAYRYVLVFIAAGEPDG